MRHVFQSAATLARRIRDGKVTSVAVVSEHLDHIRKHDPRIHAVVSLSDTEALGRAERADEDLARNGARGPLHGVPFTLKDGFRFAGSRTTYGIPRFKRHVPGEHCEVVRRLVDAGAVLLGRTNVPLGCFDWQCRSPMFGETLNPWDPSRTPGGSSGGAAAAVAAGFTPFDLGSDLAGSIRYPAHCCGVLGLRTTDGLLRTTDWGPVDLPSPFRRLATCGPIARDPEDLELVLSVLLGKPPPVTPRVGPPDEGPLKIAYSSSLVDMPLHPTSEAVFTEFLEKLERNGHRLEERRPDDIDFAECYRLLGQISGHEFRAVLPAIVNTPPGRALFSLFFLHLRLGDGPLTRCFKEGLRSSDNDYARAIEARDRICRLADDFFDRFDLWILPVSPSEAIPRIRHGRSFKAEHTDADYSAYLGSYLCPTTVLGTPVLTMPIGVAPSGLPIGVQVHAKRFGDLSLLATVKAQLGDLIRVRRPSWID